MSTYNKAQAAEGLDTLWVDAILSEMRSPKMLSPIKESLTPLVYVYEKVNFMAPNKLVRFFHETTIFYLFI